MVETGIVISMECNMAAILLAALHLYSHTLSVLYLVSLALNLSWLLTYTHAQTHTHAHISRGHKSAKECCWDRDT